MQALKRLEDLDERVSSAFFNSSLPPWLEAIYTVPACFFGMIPSLAVGPLWIAILAYDESATSTRASSPKQESVDTRHPAEKIVLLKLVTVALSILFLSAWGLYLRGYHAAVGKFLGRKVFYLVAYAGSVTFLMYTLLPPGANNPVHDSVLVGGATDEEVAVMLQISSLAFYYLLLWSTSVLLVLVLKRKTQRLRPCANKEISERYMARKAFPSVARFLAKYQANESFPSGDAAVAAALAIPMTYISSLGVTDPGEEVSSGLFSFVYTHSWQSLLAYWIVILACTGRIYVLAHHVGDVMVGALVPYLLHLLFTSSSASTILGLGNVYAVRWYHPVIANTVTTIYAAATSKKHNVGMVYKEETIKRKEV